MCTVEQSLVRYNASSAAVSPAPTIATSFPGRRIHHKPHRHLHHNHSDVAHFQDQAILRRATGSASTSPTAASTSWSTTPCSRRAARRWRRRVPAPGGRTATGRSRSRCRPTRRSRRARPGEPCATSHSSSWLRDHAPASRRSGLAGRNSPLPAPPVGGPEAPVEQHVVDDLQPACDEEREPCERGHGQERASEHG